MAFLVGVQNDYKTTDITNNIETNEMSLSTDFTDASIRDTLIENYITDIVNRTEDMQELTKNFENNIKAESESVQRNELNLNGCIDMSGMELEQTNELTQAVAQGFELLFDDIKILRRATQFDSSTGQSSDVTSESAQSAAQQTTQSTSSSQKSDQSSAQASKQKQTFTHKYASGGGLRESYYSSRRAGSSMVKAMGSFFGKLVGVKPKQESYVEHFMNYYYKPSLLPTNTRKEGFFPLFTKLSVQNTIEKIKESTNEKNNISVYDYKTNIETQDIYKKIESVYNKCNEVISKIKEEQNIINTSVARAQSIQENKLMITNQSDVCALKLNSAKLTQSNKLTQTVELKNIVKSINSLGSDNESKAIMADMFGLTAGSKTTQSVAQTSSQTATAEQSSSQTATQISDQSSEMSPLGGMGNIVAIFIVIAIIGAIGAMFKASGGQIDPFFDAVGVKKPAALTKFNESVQRNSRQQASMQNNTDEEQLTGGFYF